MLACLSSNSRCCWCTSIFSLGGACRGARVCRMVCVVRECVTSVAWRRALVCQRECVICARSVLKHSHAFLQIRGLHAYNQCTHSSTHGYMPHPHMDICPIHTWIYAPSIHGYMPHPYMDICPIHTWIYALSIHVYMPHPYMDICPIHTGINYSPTLAFKVNIWNQNRAWI